MDDFNDLTQKTDLALKANADAAGGKADGAATNAALEALAKNLGVVGHNARVTWGSYTGTGTYGASNQNSLEFGFCPCWWPSPATSWATTPLHPRFCCAGRASHPR